MPFALLIIGVMFLTVAVRNTQDQFIDLVKGDFSGPGNFWYWIVALLAVGLLGNVRKLKPVADGLLVLILLALVLSRGNPSFPGGGFFTQFTNALQGTQSAAAGGLGISAPSGIVSGFGPSSGGGIGITLPPVGISI